MTDESDRDPFDAEYWRNVATHGTTCTNCGHVIKPYAGSTTGWWHVGDWQGIRCPGMLCGATPISA